jgi:hypothetical protein
MAKRKQTYVNLETAPEYYVNSVGLGISAFDFRLVLGVIQEADEEKLITKTHAKVYMSPQHTKVLARMLVKYVDKYEETNGPISIDTALLSDDDVAEESK